MEKLNYETLALVFILLHLRELIIVELYNIFLPKCKKVNNIIKQLIFGELEFLYFNYVRVELLFIVLHIKKLKIKNKNY